MSGGITGSYDDNIYGISTMNKYEYMGNFSFSILFHCGNFVCDLHGNCDSFLLVAQLHR